MKTDRLYSILRQPHVTEKSNDAGEKANVHTFRVRRDATKREIKEAVEKLFEVDVLDVRTLNVKGKVKRRLDRRVTRTPAWKKAYVRLKEADDIDFTELS